jgi:hypothetical protein
MDTQMRLLPELSEHFGLGHYDLMRIISTAPARYKVYEIEKRNGGKRTIAHPSRELKEIQRYLLAAKLSHFPVHEAATAYVAGRSISSNAERHKLNSVILKLDFSDFFPSIKVKDWEAVVRQNPIAEIDMRDLPLYSKIFFWGVRRKSTVARCLSIGAPTSPALSNIMMYSLDTKFAAVAQQLGLTYSRYADDITLSATASERVLECEHAFRSIVRESTNPKLTFNEKKRGLYHRGQRRMVTGLVITPQMKVSIGRERKRRISSLLHKSSLGQLDTEDRGLLKGLLGFSLSVEPAFVERLRAKYGSEAVDVALKFHVPARLRQ